MKFTLPSIQHNKAGFTALVNLFAQTEGCFLEEITIDMSATYWFDADMCAVLGAILYRLGNSLNSVQLTNIRPDVEKILSKNGFLSNYGRKSIPDKWGTTVPYERFETKDDRYFAGYIEARLVGRAEMPRMSPVLIKKFRESVFEIFSNAVIHSKTELGIFGCGQYFPRRHRLDFAVADLGVGIRHNVREYIGRNVTAEEAIIWATKDRNTTKRGSIPGGLGLKLLQDFIQLNGGRILIVSDKGYWQFENDQVHTAKLPYPFPGTVVSLEINTADTQSYVLSSEISESNIF